MAYNLESLLKILHQILHPHPHPRIQLDSQQKLLLDSLLEKVNFLNQVFENPTWGLTTHEIEDLERRITDAAYDAEDVIESHLANHLLLFLSPNDAEDVIQSHLRDQILMICPLDLQRVIENFELIKEEITKMMDKIHTTPGPGASSSSSSLPVSSLMGPNPHNIVVGINEDLLQLKHKLTNDYEKNLEVIPIVGMGGIAYNKERIMSDLSKSILGNPTDELTLYQTLCGRRYLIVLDDMWNSQDWDSMKRLFPNNRNGSRVIVTTRELTVAMMDSRFAPPI